MATTNLTPEERRIVEVVKAELLAATTDVSAAPLASAAQVQALAALSADNQLMRLTVNALLSNLAEKSGLIQFEGVKAPAKTLSSAAVVAAASLSYSFSVYLNPATNKFYIERRNKDSSVRGAVVSCHSSWTQGQSETVTSDIFNMDYYGTHASGGVTPYAERIYADADGRLYVYANSRLNSAIPHDARIGDGIFIRIDSADNKLKAGNATKNYLTIGPHAVTDISRNSGGDGIIIVDQGKVTFGANVTLGHDTSLQNVKLRVDPNTGMFFAECVDTSRFGQLAPLTTGGWNTMGSSNTFASNITIGDRSRLNAEVVSYSNSGLLSIRHVIDASDYSGMEHLNLGGYNVIGSNNTLASNIEILDNAFIGENVIICADAWIGDSTFISDSVCIDESVILPAGVHLCVEGGVLKMYGAHRLLGHGLVPYIFRNTTKHNHVGRYYHGADIAGWNLLGCDRIIRIKDSVVEFAQTARCEYGAYSIKKGINAKLSDDLFSPSPYVLVPVTKDNSISWGKKSLRIWRTDKFGEHYRMLNLRFAIGFAWPGLRSTKEVMQRLMTPLFEFSVRLTPNKEAGYVLTYSR